MPLKQTIEILDTVDSPSANGAKIRELFARHNWGDVHAETIEGYDGKTDFVKILVPGVRGRSSGGNAPTIGIIGRLGGLGARPQAVGYVSDGDGAVAALSAGLKLAQMHLDGDFLQGDVIVSTHVCPDAPTRPHDPVPFMDSPVGMATMNEREVDSEMDAILSIDTTKGNRLVNHRGIAISCPAKEGWVLRITDDLLDVYQTVTGYPPVLLPINVQDVTPYGNGVRHVNSIMQPAVATSAPVVGLAITAESAVAGSATGASHEVDISLASRFAIEAAKLFGDGRLAFYDEAEFDLLVEMYGSMRCLQTAPENRSKKGGHSRES